LIRAGGSEAFGTACGLAVIAGALSVLAPGLDLLVAAMVALGCAGWASLHRRAGCRTGFGRRGPLALLLALGCLGGGAAVFLDAPAPLRPWRALALGLALVPLWAIERRRTGPRSDGAP
jgi:hypothetical protein